jgi:hypothetical protein
MRKAAKKLCENEEKVLISDKNLSDYLGAPIYLSDEIFEKTETGVATGLAWTAAGGEVLPIEVLILKGSGKTEANKLGAMQHLEARFTATAGKNYIAKKFSSSGDPAKRAYSQDQAAKNDYYKKLYKDIANEKMKPGVDYTFEDFYVGNTRITRIRRTSDGETLYNYELTTTYH